jgi:hypothetical protein
MWICQKGSNGITHKQIEINGRTVNKIEVNYVTKRKRKRKIGGEKMEKEGGPKLYIYTFWFAKAFWDILCYSVFV